MVLLGSVSFDNQLPDRPGQHVLNPGHDDDDDAAAAAGAGGGGGGGGDGDGDDEDVDDLRDNSGVGSKNGKGDAS